MAKEYRADDWQNYIMDWWGDPHPYMEPLENEIREVHKALSALVHYGILPHSTYDHDKMQAHRESVEKHFEIPWTGISPRMQRLLYAINAIAKPNIIVAMGIFCGNTFISNAGAAIGPGACYRAARLIGIEIDPGSAELARKNIVTLDTYHQAEIITADGVRWLRAYTGIIDLLYIDADGAYLPIIKEASKGALHRGSLVLAHNSVNFSFSLASYLKYVRNPAHSIESVNMYVDDQGLEVTLWSHN